VRKKTLKDIEVKHKRVLVRVDFNVPVSQEGKVRDDYRIRMSIPTINYLRENSAKVILMSHLGRPGGVFKQELKMDPIAETLSNLMDIRVRKLDDCIGENVKHVIEEMKEGEVILLENLRFHKGEEENDPEFSKSLAELGDIYVDDAFATAHRDAASNVGITAYLPSVSGLLMDKEISTLSGLLESPNHPFLAILGGAKVSDKIGLIKSLTGKVDEFLIGGGMCFTFLKARGYKIGYSICEESNLTVAEKILEDNKSKNVKFILPVDFLTVPEVKPEAPSHNVDVEEFPEKGVGVDIGPKTIKMFKEELLKAKTVIWNGPLGVFEIEKFAKGTYEIAEFLGNLNNVITVAGGGETAEAFRKFGFEGKITHISTGGGAFLEFLEGKTLPAVDALNDKD
jgi:3-phosphoglycerate kinase